MKSRPVARSASGGSSRSLRHFSSHGIDIGRRSFLASLAGTSAYVVGCNKAREIVAPTPLQTPPTSPQPSVITDIPGVNMQLFREMCLGIGAPYPFGGTPINSNGRSYRLRDGITPQILIVRNPEAFDVNAKYQAFIEAQPAFEEFTQGKVGIGKAPVFLDSEPEDPPEGAVICLLDRDAGFTALSFKSGFHIIWARVRIPRIGPVTSLPLFISGVEHEYGHAIGLDHVSDPNALMYPKLIRNLSITEDEKNAARAKYELPAGSSL